MSLSGRAATSIFEEGSQTRMTSRHVIRISALRHGYPTGDFFRLRAALEPILARIEHLERAASPAKP